MENGNEHIDKAYPPFVKNLEAYKIYLTLSQHPLFSGNDRYQVTSVVSLTIDLIAPKHHIIRKISNLPLEERNRIEELMIEAHSIRSKVAAFKTQAYGIKNDGLYTFSETILDSRKEEVLELFSRMLTTSEIHKIITQEWKLDINISTVKSFKARNKEKIKKLKLSYQLSVPNSRFVGSIGRIEELIWIYNLRKEQYTVSGLGKDEKLLLNVLDQIRKESTTSTNRSNTNTTAKSNLASPLSQTDIKAILGESTLMAIILGRIAARTGTNPAYLMFRLETSMYAKFNGTQALPYDEEGNMEDVVYPSSFVYDFDKINKVVAQHQIVKEEKQKVIDITPIQTEEAESTRERLLRLLAEKKTKTGESAGKIAVAEAAKRIEANKDKPVKKANGRPRKEKPKK